MLHDCKRNVNLWAHKIHIRLRTYALTTICVSDDGHTKGGNM